MWTTAPPPAGCSKQSVPTVQQQQRHGHRLRNVACERRPTRCRGRCRAKSLPWADVRDAEQIGLPVPFHGGSGTRAIEHR